MCHIPQRYISHTASVPTFYFYAAKGYIHPSKFCAHHQPLELQFSAHAWHQPQVYHTCIQPLPQCACLVHSFLVVIIPPCRYGVITPGPVAASQLQPDEHTPRDNRCGSGGATQVL